ncbi:MAG: DUF4351 domain-containing protein [Merismopedia sp. SIO2A8]|nr:DUF4351 domain-containing protein [Merismopedia sp. SIO2A8]
MVLLSIGEADVCSLKRSLLTRLLSLKLGPLPDSVSDRLAQLPLKQLDTLAERIFSMNTLEDVLQTLDDMEK